MPTLNKLEYLDETKQEIKGALNTKFNSGITDSDTFRSYVDKIKNIYTNWPRVTGEDTSLSLTPTKKGLMSLNLKGNTSQNTTTGKNLFDISKVLTNGTALVNNGNGTLTVTAPSDNTQIVATPPRRLSDYCPSLQVGDSVYFTAKSTGAYKYIYLQKSASVWDFGTQRTITQNDLDSVVGWYASGVSTSATISEIMVSTTNDSTYEPYTNGASPNPDYPQDINVVTGDNTINIVGKNLLNRETCDENKALNFGTGEIFNENNSLASDYIKINIGEEIYCTYNCQKLFYDKDKNYIGCLKGDGTVDKVGGNADTRNYFTVPNVSEIYYLKLGFRTSYNSSVDLLTANIMVNKGNSLATYEPYKSQTYPINLGTTELCKIGTYQDYLYKDSGKWYIHKEIGKKTFTGEENIIGYSPLNNDATSWFQADAINDALNVLAISNNYLYSDYFSIYNCYDPSNVKDGMCYHNDKKIQFRISNSLLSDISKLANRVASFKTWLSTHNTKVYYLLETPTNTEITDTTLINQLNAIASAMSYDTQTNISQTNSDLGFIISASALKKGGN